MKVILVIGDTYRHITVAQDAIGHLLDGCEMEVISDMSHHKLTVNESYRVIFMTDYDYYRGATRGIHADKEISTDNVNDIVKGICDYIYKEENEE